MSPSFQQLKIRTKLAATIYEKKIKFKASFNHKLNSLPGGNYNEIIDDLRFIPSSQ